MTNKEVVIVAWTANVFGWLFLLAGDAYSIPEATWGGLFLLLVALWFFLVQIVRNFSSEKK